MRVVFIYRSRKSAGYSIEGIFHVLAEVFRERGLDVVEFELRSASRVLEDARLLASMNADIYHITGDVNYMALLLPSRRTVLTLHDIGYLTFKLRGVHRLLYKWLWLTLPISKAGNVTCVSEFTRASLARMYGSRARKFRVVSNCHHPSFRHNDRIRHFVEPRILQVGTHPHKNVSRLIKALEGVDCILVLIGELGDDLTNLLDSCHTRYENHVGLSIEGLVGKYREADIVTFVSLFEGFGMPVIEAQAMGIPLVASNIPPISDVAGEGACKVDPASVSSIREGIRRVIDDGHFRRRIVEWGLQNVKRFSPSSVADEYMSVYRGVAGDKAVGYD